MNVKKRSVEARRERIMEGLRGYGRAFQELGRLFATGLGLHTTDALALLEIIAAEERGAPLSQARLSERIDLSAGATSSLLSRLEERGHVRRAREHEDRRVVTLRSTPEIRRTADGFFAPLGARLDALASRYPRDVLEQMEQFIGDLHVTMDAYVAEKSKR